MSDLDEETQLQLALALSAQEYEDSLNKGSKPSAVSAKSEKKEKRDNDNNDDGDDEVNDEEDNDENPGLSSSVNINIRSSASSEIQNRSSIRESSDSTFISPEIDGFQFEEVEIKEKKPYEVLSRKDIIRRQTAAINKVCDFLCLPFSSGRVLLQMFDWDVEKLLERWAEDSKSLCKKAGIIPPEEGKQRDSNLEKGKGECTICSEDEQDLVILSCGHGFCTSCWKEYLKVAISEKRKQILCPAFKCGRTLDEFFVLQLVGDKKTKKKFNENLVASYVEHNPFVRWCPAPNCKYAILLKELEVEHNEQVTCKCGHSFCFRCDEEGHQPAFCSMYKDWKVKNAGGDDALNEKAIASLARPCPRCKTAIEKNGGCNHMTCWKCHFHFCWQCMQKFGSGPDGGTDGYGNHKCNGYYQEDAKLKTDKEDWERFRWYAERFNNHARSRVLEKKLLDDSKNQCSKICEVNKVPFSTTHFYVDAIKALLEARGTLLHSYIFGFYRPFQCPEIHKDLFEHRQNELERHTEMLARLIEEKNLNKMFESRTEITNITKLVLTSRKALLDVASNAIDPKVASSLRSSNRKPLPRRKKTDDNGQNAFDDNQLENLTEEEILQRVLEISKREVSQQSTQEDRDIQEAISRSLQEFVEKNETKGSKTRDKKSSKNSQKSAQKRSTRKK